MKKLILEEDIQKISATKILEEMRKDGCPRRTSWKKLKGTYKKPIGKEEVERLIAGIQQEIIPDELDMKTLNEIEKGLIDWLGERKV